MKKILTLVVAFALVFAIAAPALAITGDTTPDTTNPVNAPVSVSVELFTGPETLAFNGFNVSAIAANKAYVVNEVAFYGVALNFPLIDGTHLSSLNPTDYEGSNLVITCDAFALSDIALADSYEKIGTTIGAYAGARPALNLDDELVLPLPAGNPWGTGHTLYFFGQGTVAAKGVLKASVVKTDDWVGGLQIYKADAVTLRYTVDDNGTNFVVDKGTDDGLETVTFVIDGNDEVTAILVNGQEIVFRKLVSGGGSVVAQIGLLLEGDVGFAEAKALYEEVMAFFGFNYDAEGRLLRKHFEAKAASLNIKDEAVVQLYTADIVVPGGVVPPKTGDSASIVGFAMIVLAMVACGVVVSRKVRA